MYLRTMEVAECPREVARQLESRFHRVSAAKRSQSHRRERHRIAYTSTPMQSDRAIQYGATTRQTQAVERQLKQITIKRRL
jgi:uncharacterized protein YgbK (DUF1537 family)